MPAEETGTASRNTHEYKNQGNGSLQIEIKNIQFVVVVAAVHILVLLDSI